MSRVEIRHLRYFLAVAEELSFSRAAQRLGMAQPPLSQQIAQLEQIIGQRLFDRKPQVRLTATGKALAKSARKLVAQVQIDLEEARRAGIGELGTLTLGFPASALLTWFPQIVRSFRDNFPEVHLRLQEISSAEQMVGLHAGAIDVGLLRGEVHDERVVCEPLLEEPYVAVLPGGHPLGERISIRLREFAAEPLIFFPRAVAPKLHDEIWGIFREAGVQPVTVMEAQEWLTIIGLVETGIGVTVAPASFRRLKWGEVRYATIEDVTATTSISLCISRKNNNPVVSNFLDLARRHRAQLTNI